MGDLIKEFFLSFNDVITGLASGMKSGWLSFLYEDPLAEELVVSGLAKGLFFFAGISLALAVGFGIFKLIRHKV